MGLGIKKIETRGWNCGWRGPLAIHATATWRAEVLRFLRRTDLRTAYLIRSLLEDAGVKDYRLLPLGSVLCTLDVVDCRPTEELRDELDEQELALGDYRPRRFGIITANLQRLPVPVPAKGAQGLWNWRRGEDQ
jgi:hypothetical protein